jgi:hypothetical protein
MPTGVHLAVVDPAVGSDRRPVALRTGDGRFLVGPDNGLLMPAAERLGGVVEAVDVSHSPFRLEPVSATFHGRDIFAPVAARLAAGEPLASAGEPCDAAQLEVLLLPTPRLAGDEVIAHVLTIDRFGNAQLDVSHELAVESGLKIGQRLVIARGRDRRPAQYARTFVDVEPGAVLVYEDAARMLAIAVNRGDAARLLSLGPDDELRIAPA